MAPRGKPKKKETQAGLQRIDAAFDALQPYGFSKDVIRKTIRDLLKVYGGDEGCIFMEEASYKLVIEAILKHQAQDGEGENKMMELIGGVDVDNSMTLEMNESVVDAEETSLHPEVISEGLQSGLGELDLTSGGMDGCENKLPATAGDCSPSTLPVTAEDASPSNLPGHGWRCQSECTPGHGWRYQSNLAATAGDGGPSCLQQPHEAPRRRRPPCYGWISESEAEA